jgi:hydroxymethylpyrimidine/phosphomethylpyrimidine kinase
VKLGERGAVLVPQDGPPLIQRAIRAPVVVDTTGAGDTFTAAYAVALVEHQSPSESLRFAGSIFPLSIWHFTSSDWIDVGTGVWQLGSCHQSLKGAT